MPHEYKFDAVKRTRYGGVGGITDIATGSANISTPILATFADMTQRAESKTALFRQLGGLHPDDVHHLLDHEQVVRAVVRRHDGEIEDRFLYRRKVVDMIFRNSRKS